MLQLLLITNLFWGGYLKNKLILLSLIGLMTACASHSPSSSQTTTVSNATASQTAANNSAAATESTLPVLVEDTVIKQQMPNAILFDLYESKVSEQFMPIIAWNAGYLLKFPNAKVELQGNADDKHNSVSDEKLAMARAQNVKDVLLYMGVNDQQITIKSLGNKHLVFAKDSDGHQPRNQRVDIMYTVAAPQGYHIDKIPVVITTSTEQVVIPEPIY